MKTSLEQACFSCKTNPMSLQEALAWAKEHLQADKAWVLAEAPEQTFWQPLKDFQLPNPRHCLRMLVFSENGELRYEQAYDADAGNARLALKNDNADNQTWVRYSEYPCPGGVLQYAEHFAQDENTGALVFKFGRYCGVKN